MTEYSNNELLAVQDALENAAQIFANDEEIPEASVKRAKELIAEALYVINNPVSLDGPQDDEWPSAGPSQREIAERVERIKRKTR